MEGAALEATPPPGELHGGGAREGPEDRRARLRLVRRHRRRLDRPGLQPRGRRSGSSWPPSASRRRRSLLVAFVPMFLIAGSYYSMNRVDPDCGTTFTWVTKGSGRSPAGSPAGRSCSPTSSSWRACRRSPASTRSSSSAPTISRRASSGSTVVGVIWIVVMTWICYVGIELSAKTQWFLLGAEIVTLALFAVIASGRSTPATFPTRSTRA